MGRNKDKDEGKKVKKQMKTMRKIRNLIDS